MNASFLNRMILILIHFEEIAFYMLELKILNYELTLHITYHK